LNDLELGIENVKKKVVEAQFKALYWNLFLRTWKTKKNSARLVDIPA
jgi:hypothetical protein